ncbi:MAG: hypothetical protein GY769_03115 [bacterium]|nr:hypothetical protein [bacterium]
MRRFLVIASLFALMATGPVVADVFTVTLTSGATFVTRYQPQQSDTREDQVLLLTEFGNWIFLPKEAIVSVASDTESKGFGTVLDSQTIALGWIPPSMQSQADPGAELDPTTRLINFMREQNSAPPAPVYSNDLVVEPSQSTGIPIGFTNRTTPPLGATQGRVR